MFKYGIDHLTSGKALSILRGELKAHLDEKAKAAIQKTEAFYQSLGIKTRLRDYTDEYEGFSQKVAKSLTDHGLLTLGEHRDITPEVAAEIVEMAY